MFYFEVYFPRESTSWAALDEWVRWQNWQNCEEWFSVLRQAFFSRAHLIFQILFPHNTPQNTWICTLFIFQSLKMESNSAVLDKRSFADSWRSIFNSFAYLRWSFPCSLNRWKCKYWDELISRLGRSQILFWKISDGSWVRHKLKHCRKIRLNFTSRSRLYAPFVPSSFTIFQRSISRQKIFSSTPIKVISAQRHPLFLNDSRFCAWTPVIKKIKSRDPICKPGSHG